MPSVGTRLYTQDQGVRFGSVARGGETPQRGCWRQQRPLQSCKPQAVRTVQSLHSNVQRRPAQRQRPAHGTVSRNLTIAVDIDEVLGQFLRSLNDFAREQYGFHHQLRDYQAYNFAQTWSCSQDTSNEVVHAFFLSRQFSDDIQPMPGALESLQRLGRQHKLVVVTSRQHCIREPTLEWLGLHYPHIFAGVHFGNHWALSGSSRKKSEICREIGASLLIDDNPIYACDCAAAGLDVILYDWKGSYPWSHLPGDRLLHPRIKRVTNWASVEQEVAKLAVQAGS